MYSCPHFTDEVEAQEGYVIYLRTCSKCQGSWAEPMPFDSWDCALATPLEVQFSSVTQSCLTLCNPMDCSTPGFPIHHQLLKLAQTHVHRVSDAIQASHPLLSPSPHAFNLSQHNGLYRWVSFSHQVAKVLEFQLQLQSFQWIVRIDFLYDWQAWSPCSLRDSQESSPTPQFQSINSSVLSFLYSPTERVLS